MGEKDEAGSMSTEAETAFDEAFGAGEGEGGEAAAEAAAVVVDTTQAQADVGDDGKAAATAAESIAQTDGAQAAAAADDEKDLQRYRTLQGIHRKDTETWAQKEADYQRKLAEYEAGKTNAKPSAPTLSWDELMAQLPEEQRKELEEYDSEFDIVSKNEGVKRDMFAKAILAKVNDTIQEALEKVTGAVAPIREATENITKDKHFGSIRESHPDFEKLRDDGSIMSWIEEQPEIIRDRWYEVYSKGKASEVVALIDQFKKDKGLSRGQGGDDHANQRVVDRDKKLQGLRVVASKKGGINLSTGSADDFDSAFDEAIQR